mmetsp:Transcript_66643/g.147991  ORF Transcript_66643/g.147991 Transcript_66643/m.147991 type:complete len:235 (-) Transcript_66643:165-869(-)
MAAQGHAHTLPSMGNHIGMMKFNEGAAGRVHSSNTTVHDETRVQRRRFSRRLAAEEAVQTEDMKHRLHICQSHEHVAFPHGPQKTQHVASRPGPAVVVEAHGLLVIRSLCAAAGNVSACTHRGSHIFCIAAHGGASHVPAAHVREAIMAVVIFRAVMAIMAILRIMTILVRIPLQLVVVRTQLSLLPRQRTSGPSSDQVDHLNLADHRQLIRAQERFYERHWQLLEMLFRICCD